MTSSVPEWAHECMSTIGHAPYICYAYVNVSWLCHHLVPGIYSRPGVYLLLRLAYPWHINKVGVYLKEAFIRGNAVHMDTSIIVFWSCDPCSFSTCLISWCTDTPFILFYLSLLLPFFLPPSHLLLSSSTTGVAIMPGAPAGQQVYTPTGILPVPMSSPSAQGQMFVPVTVQGYAQGEPNTTSIIWLLLFC